MLVTLFWLPPPSGTAGNGWACLVSSTGHRYSCSKGVTGTTMARKLAGTPLGAVLIELRHQAESLLDTLRLPRASSALLTPLLTHAHNETETTIN